MAINRLRSWAGLPAFFLAFFAAWILAPVPVWALSDIQSDAAPSVGAQTQPGTAPGTPQNAAPLDVTPGVNDDGDDLAAPDDTQAPQATRPQLDPKAPLPEISYDLGKLPAAVRDMHDKIVAACKTGDIEKLRPLIGKGSDQTQVSLGGNEGDPISFLHDLSGDTDGQEILAILDLLLESGYVHINIGKPDEAYVWPYFFAIPLSRLNASQRVELFKIVTAGDYEDMKTFDAYVFYRVGITPQGKWAFFVAGD